MVEDSGLKNLQSSVDEGIKLVGDRRVDEPINKIFLAGQGCFRIAAELLKNYLAQFKMQVEVVSKPELPRYADKNSLVFIGDFKGDSEDSVLVFRDGVKKWCRSITMTTGGKLEKMTELTDKEIIKLPLEAEETQTYYFLTLMLKILENSNIIEEQPFEELGKTLKSDSFEEMGEDLAAKLEDKTPLIYVSQSFKAAGLFWKQQLNKVAKTHCFTNTFPELCFDELEGFGKLRTEYYTIIIKDKADDRIDKTKDLIKGLGLNVFEMKLTKNSKLEKMFTAMLIGDWMSQYLANRLGIEGSETKLVNKILS